MSITFPGTVASLRQQWGRAGRRDKGGLAIYVAGDDALDQFFCRHPEKFLERPVEAAILDHASENIYMRHLLAAAYEAPLEPADRDTLGAEFETYAKRLVSAGELRERDGRYLPRKSGFPAGRVSLRSASPDSFTVLEAEAGEILGFVEAERAFSTVHPGAIYLHLGEPYEVLELDIGSRRAIVRSAEADYYTQPKIETETFIEEIREERDVLGVELRFGIVSVMEEVVAFQRKRLADHEVIDLHTVDLPEQNFVTQALWYELGEDAVRRAAARSAARARCTRPSTPRSPSSLCWRCATAGTSAACRPTTTIRPAARRSSSMTVIRVESASRGRGSTGSSGWSVTRARWSASVHARPGAPRVSSRPSAAT